MQSKTTLKVPDAQQLKSLSGQIREGLLCDWDADDIALGIRRVRSNEIGDVSDVYVSPGIFSVLCHQHFGNRKRKPFELNGLTIKQWRP